MYLGQGGNNGIIIHSLQPFGFVVFQSRFSGGRLLNSYGRRAGRISRSRDSCVEMRMRVRVRAAILPWKSRKFTQHNASEVNFLKFIKAKKHTANDSECTLEMCRRQRALMGVRKSVRKSAYRRAHSVGGCIVYICQGYSGL